MRQLYRYSNKSFVKGISLIIIIMIIALFSSFNNVFADSKTCSAVSFEITKLSSSEPFIELTNNLPVSSTKSDSYVDFYAKSTDDTLKYSYSINDDCWYDSMGDLLPDAPSDYDKCESFVYVLASIFDETLIYFDKDIEVTLNGDKLTYSTTPRDAVESLEIGASYFAGNKGEKDLDGNDIVATDFELYAKYPVEYLFTGIPKPSIIESPKTSDLGFEGILMIFISALFAVFALSQAEFKLK